MKEVFNVRKKGADDNINKLVQYAYSKGGKDFVLTLNAENGLWTTNRKSMVIGANGHHDYGICQLNSMWHRRFIKSEDFKDPYKQIDYCHGVYQDGMKRGIIKTTFYGYNVRWKSEKDFIGL